MAMVFRVKHKLYCSAATDAFHDATYANYSANAISITYTDYHKA